MPVKRFAFSVDKRPASCGRCFPTSCGYRLAAAQMLRCVRFTRLRLNGFKSFVDPTDLVIA
jgi:hypothetical protein